MQLQGDGAQAREQGQGHPGGKVGGERRQEERRELREGRGRAMDQRRDAWGRGMRVLEHMELMRHAALTRHVGLSWASDIMWSLACVRRSNWRRRSFPRSPESGTGPTCLGPDRSRERDCRDSS